MKKILFGALLLCGFLTSVRAAVFYVRDGGPTTSCGSNWAVACDNLDNFGGLSRGATYYVADGFYPWHQFMDGNSGSSQIIIRKALSTGIGDGDHGPATDWNPSYGDGQAVWDSYMLFLRDNYVFDGGTRGADWRSGYGFKIRWNSGNTPNVAIGDPNPTLANNIIIRNVEMQGSGQEDLYTDKGVQIHKDPDKNLGANNITIEKCYIHDQGNCFILARHVTGLTIQYCWLARNGSTPTQHGEGASLSEGMTNTRIAYNVWEDADGTGYIASPTVGHPGCSGETATNFWMYGNVFFRPSGSTTSTGNGLLYFFDMQMKGEAVFYNNTIIGLANPFVGFDNSSSAGRACGEKFYVKNNLWYNNSGSVATNGNNVADSQWDHNYYNATSNGDSDPNKQTGTGNPFPNLAAKDFRLGADTVSGTPLPAPYDKDMSGNSRSSWDRGALEFGSAGPAPTPTPPPANNPHPADTNSDFLMVLNEATKYGACWKNPAAFGDCPSGIAIDYAVRAGTLWAGSANGQYQYNSASACPLCWEIKP